MIDLTPLEVRKKKGDFRRGMRGYDPQSVDDFLDLVADRLEQLVRENAAMRDRLTRVEDQVNDYRERERALTEALVTAQEMREQMRQQIEREAELKRKEAEAEAENIRSEARQSLAAEEESLRRLRARQQQFMQSYRAFLERELAELAAEMESLQIGRGSTASAPTSSPTAAPQAAAPAAQRPAAEPRNAKPAQAAPAQAAAQPTPPAPAAPQGGGAPREKTFDELLNALPGFAGVAEPKQVDSPPAEPEEEAELLADVRAEFDTIADDLPLLPDEPLPGDDMIELVDEEERDDDSDGWMSTLLEGRSDTRSK